MSSCWCGLEHQDVVDYYPGIWLVSVPGTRRYSMFSFKFLGDMNDTASFAVVVFAMNQLILFSIVVFHLES